MSHEENESDPARAEERAAPPEDVEASDAELRADAEPVRRCEEPDTETNAATVEAVLFASDRPVTPGKLAEAAELSGVRAVREAVRLLNEGYEQSGRSFRIEEVAGGYQMLTLPEHKEALGRLLKSKRDARLSQAALETLAIIAYRQPILRADIEAIRGVASGEVLRGLMEKQLVRIVGRAEVLGRPMLYGTTRRFLEVFGLADLKELPRLEELRAPSKSSGAAATGPAAADDRDSSQGPPHQEPSESDASGEYKGTEAEAEEPVSTDFGGGEASHGS